MADAPDSPLVAVLAAGQGTRFGGGKLDAALADRPVGRWVLDAVEDAGLPTGVLVVPPQVPQFASASGWELLENSRPEADLASSLGCAARAAARRGADLLVLLADMPLVSADYLRELALSDHLAATAWPEGQCGVPALFPLGYLPDLMLIEGDRGAGEWLSLQAQVATLDPPADMLLDIDTPRDLAQAEDILARRRR